MKNFKLSKKLKTLLWTSSALVLNVAIASSLTSCSLFNKDVVDDIGGYDKQYGITQATYDKMENDFKEIYETDLETKHEQGDIDDEQHESSLSSFRSSLNSFHNTLNSKECKTYSYTVKTNALRDFAKDNYGIRLVRYTGVNLEDEIGQIKNSMIMNLSMMIDEYNVGAEKGKYLINNASDAFEGYVNEAKKAYPNGDILSIIQYVQDKMVGCFDGICKEMDVIVTQKFLNDFLKNAAIDVKENVSKGEEDGYHWDELRDDKHYKKGQHIEEEDFNNIFDIKIKEFIPNLNSSLVSESTKIIPFRKDMITGYTLVPIVYSMSSNQYENKYYIDVDYTLVNNRYANDIDVAKVIVHSATLNDESTYKNEDNTVFNLNESKEFRKAQTYQLPITKDYEESQIKKVYFNPTDFECTWSENANYGFDNFWVSDSNTRAEMNVTDLAASGMKINKVLLSGILKSSKTSLFGGSTNFECPTQNGGGDQQQWRIKINDEEISDDSDSIEWSLKSATEEPLPDGIEIKNGIVSWTLASSTIPKTYLFYAIANYKGQEIQSPQITLTFTNPKSTNEMSNNVINTKIYINSENDSKIKLTNLINNTNFSLDIIEHEYENPDENHNWGKIQVNGIIAKYKNSSYPDRTFYLYDLNDSISDAINVESGITKRYSKNLWTTLKDYHDYARSISNNIEKIINNTQSLRKEIDRLKASVAAISAFAFLLSTYTLIIIINEINLNGTPIWFYILIFASFVIPLIILIAAICYIAEKNNKMGTKLKKIKNIWDQFEEDKFNKDDEKVKFIWNIKNNEKYFKDEENKDKFNELSPYEQKSLKTYYSTYKNSRKEGIEPTQAQIDYENFLQIEKDNDPIKEFYEGCTEVGWVVSLILSIASFAGPLCVAYLMHVNDGICEILEDLFLRLEYMIFVFIISFILTIISITGTSIGSMWPIN